MKKLEEKRLFYNIYSYIEIGYLIALLWGIVLKNVPIMIGTGFVLFYILFSKNLFYQQYKDIKEEEFKCQNQKR